MGDKIAKKNHERVEVTVIIPAYNVEKYIDKCIASLSGQTFKNIEIIIVDDGSSDGTINIVNDLMKKDERIKLIRQNHSGPNDARKKGIDIAQGEYMMFVDADDFLDTTAISALISWFKKKDVDSIKFGAKRFPEGKILPSILGKDEKSKVFERKEVIRLLLISGCLNNLFSQIYKTRFLRSISAFENRVIFGEDLLVNFEVHQKMGRMLAIDDVLYYYRNNPSSTTNSVCRERIVNNVIDRIFVSGVLIKYSLGNKNYRDDISRIVFYQLSMIRDAMVGLARIKGYSKNDFYKDFDKMNLANRIGNLNIDKKELYIYMSNLKITKRIKYERMVRGVVEIDRKSLWGQIRVYKLYWRLRKLIP